MNFKFDDNNIAKLFGFDDALCFVCHIYGRRRADEVRNSTRHDF